ncbi:hypothetical protein KP509_01G060000 [Ceratopteris richardii]|uniref:Protein kinase domain-containing protein n=1 Tax=Ceratopteris richardii TaxID=49495 RepID=A0A8T2VLQ3_CERRI|nr:hypothetical protein KP509_01G060000 [Ceratopteris richardii]
MRWLMLKLCILFLTIPILHAEPIEFHIPPLILSPRSSLRSNGAIRNSHAFSNLADAAALKGSEEAALLLAFKASVTGDPSGALSTWKNGSSPCSWQGIKCNSRGSVSSITLQNLGLSGVFSPNTLSDLPHLTSLDLSSNNFTGSLPPSFCNSDKHSLTDLILFNNSFHGRIPSALQNCTSLVKISMYSNRLSGPMPTELASLSNLEYLALSFNHLKGNIPIPFLTNCTRLTFLALSQNEITGLLPAEIGLLANLTTLWLDSNSITGPIPSELGNLTSLTLLQLDTNRLTGQIPASLGKLTELTEVLSLSMNQLTGPIPTQIARLTKLNIMTLRGNSLNGSIPKELSNMQAIQGLFLQENSLEGTIPAELGNCTNLQQLRIYSNHLTGSIPDALGTLQYLTELNLHTNMLQGLLPTSLANLSALQKLALGFNALEGPISPALASQSMLNLSMPHNHFNGSIPSSIGNMIHVQHIDLSANNLSGSVPEDIERCLGMMNLNISHNALTGEIPSSFELLDLLEILDLSWNIFSGGIPSFLANLTNLQYINLSNNNLTGPIPSTGVFSKMNATSFLNNPGLCGAPLENNCTQPTSLDSSFEDRGIALGFKICIVISCFLFICMVLLMARYFWRKKQTVTESDDGLLKASEYSKNFRRFTPKELEIATDNFSDSSLIGMGGASKVYKAVDLTIRMVPKIEQANAAVKVLSIDNGQNLFSRELEALGTLRHRNLVKLYGFCVQGNLYAIVLEYLPKGSLQDWIYGPDAQIVSINMRLSIALDVAHGLAYLHHGLRRPMVHRDVKPSNVLFDEDMVAKVSDFGIAKLLNQDEIVSMARGTLGYIAPGKSHNLVHGE